MTPQERREAQREANRRDVQQLRTQVFGHYGRVCTCCRSEKNLSIDHIDGGGASHRRQLFGRTDPGWGFYRWLVKNNFPGGFQVLCVPCNTSKLNGLACRIDHSKPVMPPRYELQRQVITYSYEVTDTALP